MSVLFMPPLRLRPQGYAIYECALMLTQRLDDYYGLLNPVLTSKHTLDVLEPYSYVTILSFEIEKVVANGVELMPNDSIITTAH